MEFEEDEFFSHKPFIFNQQLVIPKGYTLPPICIVSGKKGNGEYLKKESTEIPWWVYVTILLWPLFLILLFVFIKRTFYSYYLDTEVRKIRRFYIFVNCLIFCTIIACLIMSIVQKQFGFVLLMILLILLFFGIYSSKIRLFRCVKISETHVYLSQIPTHVMLKILQEDWLQGL